MPDVWGLHNHYPHLGFVENGFVSVGWDELGDLEVFKGKKDKLKAAIVGAYPEAKPGAVPVWAGVLYRFAFELQVGDIVVHPYKPDSTVAIGRVAGPYRHDGHEELHRNRRSVEWLQQGLPRTGFSKSARYEIGSAVTMFRIKSHADEFLAAIGATESPAPLTTPAPDLSLDQATSLAEDEPNAERIDAYTRDFIVETLLKELAPDEFEGFVAALLRALGYRASATQYVGDGGVDVIAHRDPLGLEPPILKVQCKRTQASIGGPDVQKLTGTLSPGGSELGLFVTLGTYSKDAIAIERMRQDLRLVNGQQLVDLVLENYERLGPEWQRRLPLRRVYVVDREPEAL